MTAAFHRPLCTRTALPCPCAHSNVLHYQHPAPSGCPHAGGVTCEFPSAPPKKRGPQPGFKTRAVLERLGLVVTAEDGAVGSHVRISDGAGHPSSGLILTAPHGFGGVEVRRAGPPSRFSVATSASGPSLIAAAAGATAPPAPRSQEGEATVAEVRRGLRRRLVRSVVHAVALGVQELPSPQLTSEADDVSANMLLALAAGFRSHAGSLVNDAQTVAPAPATVNAADDAAAAAMPRKRARLASLLSASSAGSTPKHVDAAQIAMPAARAKRRDPPMRSVMSEIAAPRPRLAGSRAKVSWEDTRDGEAGVRIDARHDREAGRLRPASPASGATQEASSQDSITLRDIFQVSPIIPTIQERGFIRAMFLFTDHTMPMFDEEHFHQGLQRAADSRPAAESAVVSNDGTVSATQATAAADDRWTANCDDALGFRVLYYTFLSLGAAVQGRRELAVNYYQRARAYSGACFARPSEYMAGAMSAQAFMIRLVSPPSAAVEQESCFMAMMAHNMAQSQKYSATTRVNAAFLSRLWQTSLQTLAITAPPATTPPGMDAVDRFIDLLWFLLTQLEANFPSDVSADRVLGMCDEVVSIAARHGFLPAMPWHVLRCTIQLIVHIKKGGPAVNADELCTAYTHLRTDERALRSYSLTGLLARVVLDLANLHAPAGSSNGTPDDAAAGGARNSVQQLLRIREAASRFLLESAKIGAAPFPPEYHLMVGSLPVCVDSVIMRSEVMAAASGIVATALDVAARFHSQPGSTGQGIAPRPMAGRAASYTRSIDSGTGLSFAMQGHVPALPLDGTAPAACPPSPIFSLGGASLDSEGRPRLSVLDFVLHSLPAPPDAPAVLASVPSVASPHTHAETPVSVPSAKERA